MRNGYKMIYLPNHHRSDSSGCVYEHIVVAEEKLGRLLNKEECVHHLNSIRDDNRKENLIVFKTVSDHTAFHCGAKIELNGDVYIAKPHSNSICPNCGEHKDYSAKLCRACSRIASRKVIRPTKNELLDLIQIMPFVQIGNKYGVTDNAVRKWCKYYELPYRKKDMKN